MDKIMIDEDCKYYPCHKEMDSCLFCYCPAYPCKIDTFGEWIGKNKDVWDCSKCSVVHNKDFIGEIKELFLRELQDLDSCIKIKRNL